MTFIYIVSINICFSFFFISSSSIQYCLIYISNNIYIYILFYLSIWRSSSASLSSYSCKLYSSVLWIHIHTCVIFNYISIVLWSILFYSDLQCFIFVYVIHIILYSYVSNMWYLNYIYSLYYCSLLKFWNKCWSEETKEKLNNIFFIFFSNY